MIKPRAGEKIFFGCRFKIGSHGFVFRANEFGEWYKSNMTPEEFKNEMCEYVFEQDQIANLAALAALKSGDEEE